MGASTFNSLTQKFRSILHISYEAKIRITLALVFILILIANLNSLRFFSQSKHLLKSVSKNHATEDLKEIARFVSERPEEKIKTNHFRDLVRSSDFQKAALVETNILRSESVVNSQFQDSTSLSQLRASFSTTKKTVDEFSGRVPSIVSTIYDGDYGAKYRRFFHHFIDNNGRALTLVAVVDASEEARLEQFSRFNTLFQILSILAAATIALIMLRITFAPYRQIKTEAIAADVARPDQPESIDFAVGTFHKVIEELRQKEKHLQELYALQKNKAASLEKYNEYILQSMPSGVISCDTSGKITIFNKAAEAIFQRNSQQIIGRDFQAVFSDNGLLVEKFKSTLSRQQDSYANGIQLVMPDNRKLYLKLTSVLLRDYSDDVKGAMLLIDDLTEIKRLETEISFKEQMAALGEMSAGLAHQLRNSIATVLGFSQLLRKLTTGDEHIAGIAVNILDEIRSTESTLEKFLSYAAPKEIITEPVEFEQIIKTVETHFKHQLSEGNINLEYKIESSLPMLNCDKLLISNSLINLVQNSIDASTKEGKVIITARHLSNTNQLEIKVTDQGIGIKKSDIEKVFNPFYTAGKPHGTGLGLSLVRKWILSHRGDIKCESKLHVGTTFVIHLPLELEQPNSASPSTDKPKIRVASD